MLRLSLPKDLPRSSSAIPGTGLHQVPSWPGMDNVLSRTRDTVSAVEKAHLGRQQDRACGCCPGCPPPADGGWDRRANNPKCFQSSPAGERIFVVTEKFATQRCALVSCFCGCKLFLPNWSLLRNNKEKFHAVKWDLKLSSIVGWKPGK